MMISCPEEIAYRMGYIMTDDLRALGEAIGSNQYGQYLMDIVAEAKTGSIFS